MWRDDELVVGEFTFDALRCGPSDGETILLLHGWPESNAQWRDVGPILAEAGYDVLAPNLRGYAPGARPAGVEAYGVEQLSGDVVGMIEALGTERVHLVGHDWGGIIGWFVAGEHPELLTTYTAVSTPHPQAVVRATMADPEQHEKLQYINLLRQEGVAEEKLAADDWAYLRRMIGNLDGARLDEHLRLLGQPGALTAVLNYYRAYRPETGLALGPVTVPTTYVWGNTDVAFGRRAAEGTADFVNAPYTFVELDEGHWISDLQPEPLADAILARVRG